MDVHAAAPSRLHCSGIILLYVVSLSLSFFFFLSFSLSRSLTPSFVFTPDRELRVPAMYPEDARAPELPIRRAALPFELFTNPSPSVDRSSGWAGDERFYGNRSSGIFEELACCEHTEE